MSVQPSRKIGIQGMSQSDGSVGPERKLRTVLRSVKGVPSCAPEVLMSPRSAVSAAAKTGSNSVSSIHSPIRASARRRSASRAA